MEQNYSNYETAEDLGFILINAGAAATVAAAVCLISRRLDPKTVFGFVFGFIGTATFGLLFEEDIKQTLKEAKQLTEEIRVEFPD